MKKHIYVVAGLMTLAILAVVSMRVFMRSSGGSQQVNGFGMFSWHEEIWAEEEKQQLADCIRQADVTEIYQEFSKESLKEGQAAEFVRRMNGQNVQVYALMGDAGWAYDADGASLIRRLSRVAEYNRMQDQATQIKGVMIDVEPYLLDEWDAGADERADLMKDYLSCMEHSYAYAAENHLTYYVCIPTFYDAACVEILETLIAHACDGVAVMNYNREDEYGQMAKEVGFARAYDKEIICIYELQKSGTHDLLEINTYAGEGLKALWESAQQLGRQFGYERLRFAYHYYEPLKELL